MTVTTQVPGENISTGKRCLGNPVGALGRLARAQLVGWPPVTAGGREAPGLQQWRRPIGGGVPVLAVLPLEEASTGCAQRSKPKDCVGKEAAASDSFPPRDPGPGWLSASVCVPPPGFLSPVSASRLPLGDVRGLP